ncbi:MAG: prolipoprotein diacylglyceryl transferase [Chloroflexota bacterium]|nr:prolipoprotein diacylglyceryl transferase [Chloroflexota bacterium]
MTVAIDPVIFVWQGFALRWYPLIVILSIAVAVLVSRKEAARQGLPVGVIDDLLPWILPAGLLGARLFHGLDNWNRFAANPLHLLAINEGGLAIYGALIAGGIAGAVYTRRRGIEFLRMADVLTPGVLLALAIGRLAYIINGDAYGGPTGLPWGLTYTDPDAFIPATLLGVPTHPYPVYELLWDSAIFVTVWHLRDRSARLGGLFLPALALYATGRFVLTAVRQEPTVLLGLQEAQVVSLVTILTITAVMLSMPTTTPKPQR